MLKSTLTVLTLPSLCGVACAAVPNGEPRREVSQPQPDIILILTDQQSYNTISALGHTLASTPNLDRLVRQGITFTNAYCANPLSVPSRYALFTGTSPAGVGVWGNADRNTDAEKIRQAQEQSIGAVFRRAGYQTLYGGKIHLPNAKNKSKFAGTDNYFFEYIEKDERELLARNVGTLLREREATQPMLLVLSFLNPHDICFEARTDAEVEATLATEGKDRLKAQTIVQMRALADGADPAEYPPLPENFERTENLGPIQFPYKEFTTDYWRRYRFIYGRLVELVDRQIGEVLDAVEASANRDNTIVVFTSDHGEMAGAHQLITKGVPYDECQHVPLIIAGRGVVQGERDHSLVCNGWDLLPTLCGLAGIEAPSNGCGISLAGRAFGREELAPGRFLYLETTRSCLLIEEGKFKYTRFRNNGAEMLIDLANDPLEQNNLASDPAYADKRRELSSRLDAELSRRGIAPF